MNIYQIRQLLQTMSIYDIDLKVAYYARVSTDKEEQKTSITNQSDYYEDFIKKNKQWRYAGAYIDDGISGIQTQKREEFQRMIHDARKGKIDLIITKEISRFARNTLDSIRYTRELLSYGVCVWFQSDNINTLDDDSELRLTIMAAIAQDEVRKLSNRIKFGHAQAIKNGVVMGNSKLYGYDKINGRLLINENEAPMIRFIFEKYASGEYSTPALEEILYKNGYRSYQGKKISKGVIQHIITNPKYKGYYVGGKVKIIDMFTKKQYFVPESEWVMYPDDGNRVPAIVSEEIWDKANQRYRERSESIRSRRTSFKDHNLFTGKIICGNDGAPYWMKMHQVRGSEDPRWVCSYKIKHKAISCDSFSLLESELKILISDLLQKSSGSIDDVISMYMNIYRRVIENPTDNSSEISQLQAQIHNLQKKSDKILNYNLSGAISDKEFLRKNAEFTDQIHYLQTKLDSLQKKPEEPEKVNRELNKLAEIVKSYANICPDDITPVVINELIDRIVVSPQDKNHASLVFYLKNAVVIEKNYSKPNPVSLRKRELNVSVEDEKNLSCSDDIILTI